MRSNIFSFTLLAVSITLNCATQDKKVVSQQTEYELFAQKYEAMFGEKPSDHVWNLGKKSCDTCGNNCKACGSNGGGCRGF